MSTTPSNTRGQGGDVTVRLGPPPEGGGFQIDVADRGPGIPDAEKDKVLQRFGRGSAGTGTIGSGLGLAIVKAVADAHGGGLRLLDRPGGGLIVRLEFPQAPPLPARRAHGFRSAAACHSGGWPADAASAVRPALAVEPVVYPAPAGERHVLLIDAATDRTLMEPLILDFQRIAPDRHRPYSDFSTRDLYERTASGRHRRRSRHQFGLRPSGQADQRRLLAAL